MKTQAKVGALLLVLLAALVAVPRPTSGASRQPAAQPPAAVNLQLSRTTVNGGESLTLTASYTNLGLVHTTLIVSRPSAVRFTPAVPTPCRYNVHPDGCKTFPLEAVYGGTVTFQASANGETFDEECQCWVFRTVRSPAVTLVINGPAEPAPPVRAYLPMLTAPASGSPLTGRLVFTSSRDAEGEIHRMRADGTMIQRLTENTEIDGAADVSPDGSTIAFYSQRESGFGLFLMNSDGTNQRRLSPPNVQHTAPVWSPDGSQLAFTGFLGSNAEIYAINADGSNLRRLTTLDNSYDAAPAWSPDGQTIAFVSDREVRGHYSIYLMNPDGGNVRRLTTGNDWSPVWSPDGRRIAFTAMDGAIGSLYLMNSDGTGRTQLTTGYNVTGKAVWSPAGDLLAFNARSAQSVNGIYVVDAAGSLLRTVLQPDADNIVNDWTP
ncbi:MAG TPA: hypothetical protein VGE07_11820 [Herpetosiphonaceae bacterium]